MFYEKRFRNFAKFTGKHLCQSIFFTKVAALRTAALLKKRLSHRYFPVNFVKFLTTRFLQNTSGRLLLQIYVKFSNKHQSHSLKFVITYWTFFCLIHSRRALIANTHLTNNALGLKAEWYFQHENTGVLKVLFWNKNSMNKMVYF